MSLPLYVLAVDLGGTNFRLAWVNRQGEIAHRATYKSPPSPALFYQELHSALAQGPPVAALGLGLAGPVSQGRFLSPANLPWGVVPVEQDLTRLVGLPLALGNDATLAAWGEACFGAGKGISDFVMLTLGTGIGGGAVLGGRLFAGSRGLAMEVGHLALGPEDAPCGCGLKGHWEASCSGTGLARQAHALGVEAATAKELFDLAATTPLVQELIAANARLLGRGLAGLVHLFDPALLVFGGSLAHQEALYLAPALAEMETQLLPAFQGQVQAAQAQLGDDAGLLGAAALAWGILPPLA